MVGREHVQAVQRGVAANGGGGAFEARVAQPGGNARRHFRRLGWGLEPRSWVEVGGEQGFDKNYFAKTLGEGEH